MSDTKPQYTHDCVQCVFLGTLAKNPEYDLEEQYDLYYCPCSDDPTEASTVIARWSSDGPDYTSGNCFSWRKDSLLEVARHRAEALGITVPKE